MNHSLCWKNFAIQICPDDIKEEEAFSTDFKSSEESIEPFESSPKNIRESPVDEDSKRKCIENDTEDFETETMTKKRSSYNKIYNEANLSEDLVKEVDDRIDYFKNILSHYSEGSATYQRLSQQIVFEKARLEVWRYAILTQK